MKTMELEQLTLEELFAVKGGEWVEINGQLYWRERRSLFPEEEDE